MSILLAFCVATVSILWIVIVSRIVRRGRKQAADEPEPTSERIGEIQ